MKIFITIGLIQLLYQSISSVESNIADTRLTTKVKQNLNNIRKNNTAIIRKYFNIQIIYKDWKFVLPITVILYEIQYKFEITSWISIFERQLKEDTSLISHEIKLIEFNRFNIRNIKAFICRKLMQRGISVVIDTSIGGYNAFEELKIERNLPYIQITISKFPFINSIIKYIEAKYGTDYAIIFQSRTGEICII